MTNAFGSNKANVFTQMINAILPDYLKDHVHTCVPGHIVSFDPESQTGEVQIGLKLQRVTGERLTPSIIGRVPVQFWGATGGTLEVKVEAGTEGLIYFSQECVDSWIDQGGVAAKSETRRFAKDDAFFVPGFRSAPNAITNFSNDGIRLRSLDGAAYYWIHDDGSVEIDGLALTVKCPVVMEATLLVEGAVDTSAAIRNVGVNIGATHRHVGVTVGTGTSGIVSP